MHRLVALRWTLVGVYAVVIALTAVSAARAPAWNFDAIGYAGAALARDGVDPATLRDRVYVALQKSVPVDPFLVLIGGPYRQAVLTEPATFAAQVPLYANRIAYVHSIRFLSRTDEDVVQATHLISAYAYALLAVLLAVWTSRRAGLVPGLLLALGTMLSAPFIEGARLSTPDAACTLALSLGTFVTLELRSVWGAVALACACLFRPDAVFPGVLVLLFGRHFDANIASALRKNAAPCLLVVGAAAGASLVGYSWGAVLQHRFVRWILLPDDATHHIGLAAYLGALGTGLREAGFFGASFIPVELVLTVVAWKNADDPSVRRVLTIAWAAIGLHYVAFPLLADRFFLHSYVLIAVACSGKSLSPTAPFAIEIDR